ncbi:LacI family transcriptional regulator [Rhodobacteraceae bacterium RKSG542]|uniref:LacI family DNA-binding transcriptional regulator n=1 Tax=Pseudovibrio flavus TaxID=2529854 RepID=UPI0012BD2A7E|nr:LacI family DNA-binding transcriptional regulator [Pseudovibrio flavus]MTI17417.1 LacI family transcriptional regulator [Pseudovibrio flavus]
MTKPTIVDIARHAGVSIGTVSNALNNKGRVAEKTRKKVIASAEALGFVRDYNAARLKSGKSNLIGVIVEDITNPYMSELTVSMETVLGRNGYLPILANSSDKLERQSQLIEEMIGHGVAGIVLIPCAGTSSKEVDLIVSRKIPCVTTTRELPEALFDFVGTDDYFGAQDVVGHLLDEGCRTLVQIGGLENTSTGRLRREGFFAAHAARGMVANKDLVFPGGACREFGYETAKMLLGLNLTYDGIVCQNDIVAAGVYMAYAEAGKRIGDDVRLVGFDCLMETAVWDPPLTTVRGNPVAIGHDVAMLLLRRLEGDTSQVRRFRLTPELIIRRSSTGR